MLKKNLRTVFLIWPIAICSIIYFTYVHETAAQAAPIVDRTAMGVEADGNFNGIRDDVDEYINGLPDSYLQKKSLEQVALAFSLVVAADLTNLTALRIMSEKLSNSSTCIFSRYPGSIANKRARELEKLYFNTKQRVDAYDAYNKALNGTTSLSPIGNGCAI